MNQRDAIRMSEAEVEAFLAEMHTITLCTLNRDCSIHAVPMFYGLLDGVLAVTTKTKSQKVRNLRRNPTMTVLIEEGMAYEELRGVELIGRGDISEDGDDLMRVSVSVFERHQGRPYRHEDYPLIADGLKNRVVIKLGVSRVVSWDHRKLVAAQPPD